MFVASQPWQKDEDYKRLIQNLEPPPPPGNENEWELHFCKWWGWNWVKRKEMEEAGKQKNGESQQKPMEPKSAEPKKPEKKPKKNLCLCFKKKKDQKPLQEMYNTPSNSVIEDRVKKPEKNVANSAPPNEQQVQGEVRREVYAARGSLAEKKRKEWSTSSSDGYYCPCSDKNTSSTEESVEYINISCCPCCHPREPPPVRKKETVETCTCTEKQCRKMATQTIERERKRRRKRICVVCCSCGQGNMPRCCPCDGPRKQERPARTERKCECCCTQSTPESRAADEPPYYKPERSKQTHAAYMAQVDHSVKPTSLNVGRKFEPLYATGMPIDMMLYCNKYITKFGMPSQNYSWIHATKSDIYDQVSHLKISNEFSSPISGKTYNVSPVKVNDREPEPSVLLNPLSVDEEIQCLKKIEGEMTMDLKSRIMLDAVCDAILSKDEELSYGSSILVNEFTYPSNITQTENMLRDIYRPDQKYTTSKLNQTSLDEMIFEDVINKCKETKKVDRETSTNKTTNRQETKMKDPLRVRSPQTYAIENLNRRLVQHQRQNQVKATKEQETPYKLIDYVIKNNQPLVSVQREPAFTRMGLMSTYKRSASPSPKPQDTKKAKLREPAICSDNTSISDIFKKIDEIVMRSKVNNEEIQNVLNTIPQRTFQFFTSWEVSNLPERNPMLQIMEQGASSSSVNAVSDEIEKVESKPKAQTKKKKASKVSLIPKRVTESKLSKQ